MRWIGGALPCSAELGADGPVLVGLVNNMSDGAARPTEQRFFKLLRAAAGGRDVKFTLFTCPKIPRSSGNGGQNYADIEEILEARLDALIVTGAEPTTSTLQAEPIWASLAWVADWAEANEIPTIWSCLAAHAAVLHLNGISRVREPLKHSGVFACNAVLDGEPLTAGLASGWLMPHSRWHGLPEANLRACGYEIVSRCEAAGVDIFLKRQGAPFLFFQGHPEYDADTLQREYVRDVRRYAAGEYDGYPSSPVNYFDPRTEEVLAEIRQRALERERDSRCLDEVCAALKDVAHSASWQKAATRLCANWLRETVPGMAAFFKKSPLLAAPAAARVGVAAE